MASTQLTIHERLAASLIAGSFLLLILHNFVLHEPASPTLVPPDHIEVAITGAVEHPGEYQLPSGSILGDLLDRAQPTREANLSRLRKQRKLTHGEEIDIPTKTKLSVYLEGKQIEIPKGTRECDLRLWTDIPPELADKLNSKRKLKEGERIP